MIIKALMDLIKTVLQTLLSFIQIPTFPESWTSAVGSFMDLLFENVGMVGVIIPWPVIKLGIPILIAIINMDKIYDAIMWILRKIPMLGMS